jgi:hypothetical protein
MSISCYPEKLRNFRLAKRVIYFSLSLISSSYILLGRCPPLPSWPMLVPISSPMNSRCLSRMCDVVLLGLRSDIARKSSWGWPWHRATVWPRGELGGDHAIDMEGRVDPFLFYHSLLTHQIQRPHPSPRGGTLFFLSAHHGSGLLMCTCASDWSPCFFSTLSEKSNLIKSK